MSISKKKNYESKIIKKAEDAPVNSLQQPSNGGDQQPEGSQQELLNGVVYWADELKDANIKELPFLMHPFLPQVGMGMLYGGSDCNKSTFCRGLSFAIGTGSQEYLNFKLTPRHGNVLYVSSEDDPNAMAALYRLHFEGEPPEHTKVRFVFKPCIDKIRYELQTWASKGVNFDIAVIDSMSDLLTADLNSSRVRTDLKEYDQLAKEYNLCILWIHHESKKAEATKEASKSNAYGSVHLEAKFRFAIEMKRFSSMRTLQLTKGNWVSDKPKRLKHFYNLVPGKLILKHFETKELISDQQEHSPTQKNRYEAFKKLRDGMRPGEITQAFKNGDINYSGSKPVSEVSEGALNTHSTKANKVLAMLTDKGLDTNVSIDEFCTYLESVK